MQKLKEFWKTFSELYGPAIVGGVFLCVADLLQSGANGQIGKLGRAVGKPLQSQLEPEFVGVLVILVLGCLLCWVFRPANRGDSFSKGASVFAILAAIVPAGVTPGGLSPGNALKMSQTSQSVLSFLGSAYAQTVIPLTPTGKVVVRIVGGDGVTNDEIQASASKDGIAVSLKDPETQERVGYEKISSTKFEIIKPPKRYILELEISGFERVRGDIEVTQGTRVIDIKISRRSLFPLGIQRLYSAPPLVAAVNERDMLIERGKDASRRGQYPIALDYYNKALATNEKDKETLNYKGYTLFRLQKFEDAYKALSAARQIDGDYFLARLNFAKVACRLGRTNEATNALVGGNPMTRRQAQVALEDGEFTQICQSIQTTIKKLAENKH